MIGFLEKRAQLIRSTDPERIYVENVRSFFNITTALAKGFCEMAVKERLFRKRIGLECPTCKRLVLTLGAEEKLPVLIRCEQCEAHEEERFEFRSEEMRQIVFYQILRTNGA
jgi:hypothetical protein